MSLPGVLASPGRGCFDGQDDLLARDGRLLSIGGGTTEIMKEIITKRILEEIP